MLFDQCDSEDTTNADKSTRPFGNLVIFYKLNLAIF